MARKLPIPNGRLDGALDANGQRIVNLMNPLSVDDAATKAYVDARDAASAGELRKQVAASVGTKQDKLDSRQLAAVNSGVTEEKLANLVAKDDVVPVGTGTEVIARIGGKEIKAPAGGGGAVASVNGMKGEVYLGANDVGALPTSGGFLIDESNDTTFLAVGGVKAGLRERSYGGELVVSSKFDLETGEVLVPASIKKDRYEIATEKYVDAAKRELSARIDSVEAQIGAVLTEEF